jgi:hypothetical protein
MPRRKEDLPHVVPEACFNYLSGLFDSAVFNLNAKSLEELLWTARQGNKDSQRFTRIISKLGFTSQVTYKVPPIKELRDAAMRGFVHYIHNRENFFEELKQENLSDWQKIVMHGIVPIQVNNMEVFEWMDKLEERWKLSLPFGHCINCGEPGRQYETTPHDYITFECDRCFMEWMVVKPQNLIELEKEGLSWDKLHVPFVEKRYYKSEEGEWEKI